ncbi:TolC family protein [Puniceicoccaceae bacterium K14]|nr:TolC family protein [Puniceicoccaceae bacterium K14]
MNTNYKIVRCILFLLGGATVLMGETQLLDLSKREAMVRTLERNLGIRIEKSQLESSKEAIVAAKGDFDPEVSASFSTNSYEDLDTESIELGVNGKTSVGTTYGLSATAAEGTDSPGGHDAFVGLSFRQPVLSGFGLSANLVDLRVARYQFDLSEWEYKQTVLDTLVATLNAYNDLYEAQQNLAIAKRSRDLAKKLIEDDKRRVELGVRARLDVTSTEAQYAFRQERVLQAINAEKQSQNRLKQLIFDNAEDALSIDIVPQYYIDEYAEGDYKNYLDTLLENSPQFRLAELALEIARVRLGQRSNEKLPSLDLIAQYGFSGIGGSVKGSFDDAISGDSDFYSLGIEARYPLFNRRARAREQIANQDAISAELDLQRIKQAIQLEFRTAYEIMLTNFQRVEATRYAKEIAQRSLESEEKKLKAGTSSSFIVLRLQNDLASAESRELFALSSYNRSVARFNRLRGVLE